MVLDINVESMAKIHPTSRVQILLLVESLYKGWGLYLVIHSLRAFKASPAHDVFHSEDNLYGNLGVLAAIYSCCKYLN